MSALLRSAIAGTCLMAACHVAAADTSWSLGAGVAHTDNAARLNALEASDTIASVGGSINLDFEGSRVEASLEGNGEFQRYLDDTFDDDFVGSAQGKLVFGIVPDRFLWTFEDTFGQVTSVPFAAATPFNRNDVNVFSTGPDFLMRLGGATELRARGRLRQSTYGSDARVDDQGISGDISLTRRVSQSISWALTGYASRVEYDLPGDPGFDLQNYFVTVTGEGARQTLSLDLGVSKVNDEATNYDNPLLRLRWNRQMTPSWSLDLSAGTEYRDTSDRFVDEIGALGIGGTTDVQLSDTPAQTEFGRFGLNFKRPRLTFSFGAYITREEYEGLPLLDRDDAGFFATISRRFTERVTGYVAVRLADRDFGTAGVSDTTVDADLRLDYRAGRNVYFTLGYRNSQRDAAESLLDYDENVAYLNFSYRVGPAEAPRPFIF